MNIGKIVLSVAAIGVSISSFAFKAARFGTGNLFTKTGNLCTLKTACHTDVTTGTRACLSGVNAYTTATCTNAHLWSGKTKVAIQ